MQSMNIALPESLKEYVQEKTAQEGYSSVSEYIRELIRADQKQRAREALEIEMIRGLESGPPVSFTEEDWEAMRERIRKNHAARQTS